MNEGGHLSLVRMAYVVLPKPTWPPGPRPRVSRNTVATRATSPNVFPFFGPDSSKIHRRLFIIGPRFQARGATAIDSEALGREHRY
jgi:hypothetical protein